MKKLLMLLSLFLLPFVSPVQAAGGHGIELKPAENNLRDQDSLKRGAVLFSNYCMACHSVKYMRYNRIARDIGWTDEEIIQKMAYGQNKVVDTVETRMVDGVATQVLGTVPPDLSLMARLKGTDYIYTFLTEYYQDEKGNWDNHALKGTSMPNVLEGIQRHAKPEEYAQAARDISNFLEYVGEPAKLERLDLGWKVIAFLLVLLLLTYLLKREYWRDIKH
ncbi:cytochrome c1 [Thiomicrorhabdus sp. Kp2]|uniref:cytochrome c1 n=1 Tax=Thiomicrorhabdus sp. Kp2 TaxID=1123518 RepID=UPI00041C2E1F|nr:cytochrome c1 [Thiomicrorhabdus sp. Kp2]